MNLADFDLINEEFYTANVTPFQMDFLLSEGWRHFGQHFYRYNLGFLKDEFRFVVPLRIDLSRYKPSRSQRRVINKNGDLRTLVRPVVFDNEKHELFEKHKSRFDHGIPKDIYSFLDKNAATVPCPTLEISVFLDDKLVAVSFLDQGDKSVSSVYAMFAPEESKRSLGIFTMLLEIEFAIENGKDYYYQGYAYEGESFYDYKKRFTALEYFDWNGRWLRYLPGSSSDS